MKKVLIGCGVLVLLAVLFIGIGGYIAVQNVRQEFEVAKRTERVHEELVKEYGSAEEYVPVAPSELSPARLEQFMVVRESVSRFVRQVASDAEALHVQEKSGPFAGLRKAASQIRGSMGLFRDGMVALAVRDSLLMQQGMGEGEYVYLHCLTQYSWLANDVPMALSSGEPIEGGDITQTIDESLEQLRDMYVTILRNHRESLGEDDPWRQVLSSELARRFQGPFDFPLRGQLAGEDVAQLASLEVRLRSWLPRTAHEQLIETLAMIATGEDGFQVELGDE